MSPCVAVTVFLVLVGLSHGEIVKTQKCYSTAAARSSCTIHEVRVNPCPEAAENMPCKIKLGSNYSLSFDYTPTFNAAQAKSQAFKVGTIADIPFELMDTDGCKYTTCPIEANKKQLYTYALEVGTQFPTTTHQVTWKLWDKDDRRNHKCCFKFNLHLVN